MFFKFVSKCQTEILRCPTFTFIYLFIYSVSYLFGGGASQFFYFCNLFLERGSILKCLVKNWINGKCCVVLWSSDFSLHHNFIQQSLNSGSVQFQILLVVCQRYVMVKIWQWSQLEIRLKIFHWSTILKNKMIIMVKHTFNKIMVKHTFRMLHFR